MAKLVRSLVTCILILGASVASALNFKLEQKWSWDSQKSFSKTKVGGLSALVWTGADLFLLSDDRGLVNEPRLYRADWDFKSKTNSITLKEVIFITGDPQKYRVLDLEGLVVLPSGDFLISTEGDTQKKPRIPPGVLLVSKEGKIQKELSLPDHFIPNKSGLQKQGVTNNGAFEALTISKDHSHLWVMNERPLLTDQSTEQQENQDWLRCLQWKNQKGEWIPEHEWAYSLSTSQKGLEVARGVSEILWIEDRKFLVLERGFTLSAEKSPYFSVILYEVDFSTATDVSKDVNPKSWRAPSKKIVFDFVENGLLGNYEGMTWGPSRDGRRQVLIVSDNNFSKKTETEFVLLSEVLDDSSQRGSRKKN